MNHATESPTARKGVFAATITPVKADLTVDVVALADYCTSVMERGCDGVAPLGSAGEANSIAMGTRLRVPAALKSAGLGQDQVILGAGACAVGDAIAIAKASLDAGFPNLLVLPPFFYKDPAEDGLFAYYDQILNQAGPTARLYLYHFPRMSTVPITTRLIVRLREKWGLAIAGLKDSGGDFAVTKGFIKCVPDFRVFSGSEQFVTQNLAAGGAGCVSATTNITAALARRLVDAPPNEKCLLDATLKDIRLVLQAYPMSAMLKQLMFWHTGSPLWSTLLPPLTRLPASDRIELSKKLSEMPFFKEAFPLAFCG